MGIRCTTPMSALDDFLKRAVELIKKNMMTALAKLGEESVVKIRDRSQDESWYDHTSNLRSSIGYAVYDYGVKYMQSAFSVLGNGSQGRSEGLRMVTELASEYSNVYALVVIAAMDYADKVEAIESKDVLESTRIWALKQVESRLERAKEASVKEINSWRL